MQSLTMNDVMSHVEVQLAPTDTLTTAKDAMMSYGVRHFPIVKEGMLVGLTSIGDLYSLENILGLDPDATELKLAMATDLVTVSPTTKLRDAVRLMNQREVGSVVVTKDELPIGIFTATDASKVLEEFLWLTAGE